MYLSYSNITMFIYMKFKILRTKYPTSKTGIGSKITQSMKIMKMHRV